MMQVNPFRYRLCKIFCSSERGFMDFDDFLDLISVMSDSVSLFIWCLVTIQSPFLQSEKGYNYSKEVALGFCLGAPVI